MGCGSCVILQPAAIIRLYVARMEPIDRRAFLAGTAAAAATAAAGMVLASSPVALATESAVLPAGRTKHVFAGHHPQYSLRFFRKNTSGKWKANGMTLRLDAIHPITTGDGKTRKHDGAFAASFALADGRHLGSGTYNVTAPDGTTFPLHLSRIHHRPRGSRYVATINRWIPES